MEKGDMPKMFKIYCAENLAGTKILLIAASDHIQANYILKNSPSKEEFWEIIEEDVVEDAYANKTGIIHVKEVGI